MKVQPLVIAGQVLKVGTYVGQADNTGFSTGTHTHRNGRRVDKDLNFVDTNDASNSFDTMQFDTGLAAQDYQTLIGYYQQLLLILQKQVEASSH